MMRLWSVIYANKFGCIKVLIFICRFVITQSFHVPNVKDCIHNHTLFNMRRNLHYGGDVCTISSHDVDRQDGIGCVGLLPPLVCYGCVKEFEGAEVVRERETELSCGHLVSLSQRHRRRRHE